MTIGVFSVIEWSFLDQRPQVFAKKLAEWGHNVIYFEPFFQVSHWNNSKHPWDEYEKKCWHIENVDKNINVVKLLALPPHTALDKTYGLSIDLYEHKNAEYVKSLGLDLAITIDPYWGSILDTNDIPYFYDHVDDTHHMEHVITDIWYKNQLIAEKNAMASFYIQPRIAQRNNGLYIPNGIETKQLNVPASEYKPFDCGCLSALADWLDIDSILATKHKLLIIGPMEAEVRKKYEAYRNEGGKNVTWIPRVSRTVGAQWLSLCKTAMIPFKDDHPVVDYVMPLKLVEYLYLGLPPVSYLNKVIEDEFSDVVTFYSSLNWLDLPNLDTAISDALIKNIDIKQLKEISLEFTWDKVFEPLREIISLLDTVNKKDYRETVLAYVKKKRAKPLRSFSK